MKTDPSLNIPNMSSPGSSWIQWHKDLKSNFGKKGANQLFLKAWNKQGGTWSANTKDLRDYLEKQGINIESNILSEAYDLALSPLDALGNIMKMGKYAAIAVGVIIIGGLAMTVFSLAKSPVESLKAIKP